MTSKVRYLSPQKWDLLVKTFRNKLPTSVIGYSVLNQPIYAYTIGKGSNKVLLWSQMHGNESTTTRALFDLFSYLYSTEGSKILERLTLLIIPQLNPDGAYAYTRLNANSVDLNRDAKALSQPESVALKAVFDDFSPNFCFNLHGQRSIFAAGKMGKPATLSFLSPASDDERSLTPARLKAMQLILSIFEILKDDIPQSIARYDDTFNSNCVGDSFTSQGIPTLLFEAGHYELDYNRDFTKKMILKALIVALNSISNYQYLNQSVEQYELIPKNKKDYVDLIIRNIDIRTYKGIFKNQELALQYKEEKKGDAILFTPICHSFSEKLDLLAHRVLDANELIDVKDVYFSPEKTIDIP